MEFSRTFVVVSLAIIFCAGAAPMGCASSRVELGEGASSSNGLLESAELIRSGKDQVVATVEALAALGKPEAGELVDVFNGFARQADALEAVAGRIAATNRKMQADGARYFENWEKELSEIQSEDIRRRSAERQRQVQSSFDEIKRHYGRLTDTYEVFVTDLRDLRTALATDLTAEGVRALGDTIRRAQVHGDAVVEVAETVARGYEELGVRMSSTAR